MKIPNWMYYNHAVVPTVAPHENVDITPIRDKSIWKIDGGCPLLARWTTNFDCGYETNWWYVIKDAPFNVDDVSPKERKSIRQAIKKCDTRRINPQDYRSELYECYAAAFSNYDGVEKANIIPLDKFYDWCENTAHAADVWAAFDNESGKLIGYMTVSENETYAEIQTAKFHPEYFKRQASDALYYSVLTHYLNESGKRYVSSGARSISHKTNTQDYKIRRFGYRKAYCHLHILYKPGFGLLIKLLYPFRKLLIKLDKIGTIHKINALLLMEEIHRTAKKETWYE